MNGKMFMKHTVFAVRGVERQGVGEMLSWVMGGLNQLKQKNKANPE